MTDVLASPHRLLNTDDAADFLSDRTGRRITKRQMRRWASPNKRTGRRGLPFARCQLTGELTISEVALLEAFTSPQRKALEEWRKGKGRR